MSDVLAEQREGGGVTDSPETDTEPQVGADAKLKQACDEFVGAELERHSERVMYDDRRRDAFIQNARQRFFLDQAIQNADSAATMLAYP